MTEPEEEAYALVRWVPPWEDDGRRLLEMLNAMTEKADPTTWQVFIALLLLQMTEDLSRVAEQNARWN
jgi:hypothetical protein